MTRSFARVIRPRSIAVFGGREARRVIEQCDRMGFSGEIWPVHPRHDEILGHRCYRSAGALPGAPDAAFIGVNRALTVDIVRELAARGAGGAICYASGFSEAAEELTDGRDLQAGLIEAAGDMTVIGPNCYGLINALDGALLWPDQHGLARCERGVAILTQSSNIALNLSMQRRGLPIAYLLAGGNQAQTGLSEFAWAVLEDPRVTAVGLHIEGFDDIRWLERLAGRSRELRKPVVVLKIGKSDAARRATVSHTASLAGDHAVSAAILARLGIGQVNILPELMETLKLLHVHGPLESRSVSSMSCSGGDASLVADAATARKLEFRPLTDEQVPLLRQCLGEMVALTNPLDYHTFVWGDAGRQAVAFSAMVRGGYALNFVILDLPRDDRCERTAWMATLEAVIQARQETGRPLAIVASLAENMPEDIAIQLIAGGIVPFSGIDEALMAAEVAAKIGECWAAPRPEPLLAAAAAPGEIVTLDEDAAKAELAGFGIRVPAGRRAATPEEAALHAEAIGFPVVLKGLGLAHKSEAGAVKLGLASRAAVMEAAVSMQAAISGFLVEEMIGGAVAEMIVGVLRDPLAGPVMTIGAGGIFTELLDDAVILTLPTTAETIAQAIGRLRIAAALGGYRGRPRGDVAALVRLIAAVAGYAAEHAASLEELDINPVLVLPEGSGVVAVDALVRRREPQWRRTT